MHATLAKFGYPTHLVKDYDHWAVLLRPQQPSLASLMLIAKSDATSFSSLPATAFSELALVTADIERHLKRSFSYDRINYLMLMMVDPHVHFHVVPRYESARHFDGSDYSDAAWPGPPDLKLDLNLVAESRKALLWTLQQRFSGEQ